MVLLVYYAVATDYSEVSSPYYSSEVIARKWGDYMAEKCHVDFRVESVDLYSLPVEDRNISIWIDV